MIRIQDLEKSAEIPISSYSAKNRTALLVKSLFAIHAHKCDSSGRLVAPRTAGDVSKRAGLKMDFMAQDNNTVLTALGGNAEQISRELGEFTANARALSGHMPRFIDEYPEKWVAVYGGHIAASGDSLEQAAQDAANKGVPAAHSILRHITREEKTYFF